MVFHFIHKTGLGDSDHKWIHFVLNCYQEVKNTILKATIQQSGKTKLCKLAIITARRFFNGI